MKKTIILLYIFLVSSVAFAQTNTTPKYTVPDDYEFLLPEDYDKYQPQILEAIDWYLWRSMGMDSYKREKAATFFMQWIAGSPTVSIEIDTNITEFMDTNPQLLLPFTMGATKYVINHTDADKIKTNVAAIQTIIDYYHKNRAFMDKDNLIEKYENLLKKKKLEAYISKNLSSAKHDE